MNPGSGGCHKFLKGGNIAQKGSSKRGNALIVISPPRRSQAFGKLRRKPNSSSRVDQKASKSTENDVIKGEEKKKAIITFISNGVGGEKI